MHTYLRNDKPYRLQYSFDYNRCIAHFYARPNNVVSERYGDFGRQYFSLVGSWCVLLLQMAEKEFRFDNTKDVEELQRMLLESDEENDIEFENESDLEEEDFIEAREENSDTEQDFSSEESENDLDTSEDFFCKK